MQMPVCVMNFTRVTGGKEDYTVRRKEKGEILLWDGQGAGGATGVCSIPQGFAVTYNVRVRVYQGRSRLGNQPYLWFVQASSIILLSHSQYHALPPTDQTSLRDLCRP